MNIIESKNNYYRKAQADLLGDIVSTLKTIRYDRNNPPENVVIEPDGKVTIDLRSQASYTGIPPKMV